MLPTKDSIQDTYRTETEEMREDISANGKQKRTVAVFIADKMDFMSKIVIRDKEGHYIMLKESVNQEDIKL